MNEGQLLGNVFSLPDYPQGGGAGNVGQMPQQSAPDFSKIIPDVQYGLQSTANVADYTHKYYDELAAARQFANTMWHNYRIDVTKPNINNRADVAAANTFSQMLANTQAVANQMKNSQEELKAAKARPNTVINQSAFTQNTPFASLTPDQQYTDVSLDPTSVSTIKEYSGARDNTAIMAQDQKEFDAKMAYLDQAAANATDPAMKNRILQQKAQMIQAQNMYWNPPAEPSNTGYGDDDPNVKMARKYFLLSNGSPQYYTPSGEYNKEGSQIGRSTVDKGTRYGDYTDQKGVTHPFIIDHYDFDHDEKKLIIYADAPDAKPIEVKGDKILNFLGELAGSNTGGIINGATLRQALAKNKLLGKGEVDIDGNRLLSLDEQKAIGTHSQQLQSSKESVSKVREDLSKELDNMKPMGVLGTGGSSVLHTTHDDKLLTISKKGDKYFLTKPGFIGSNVEKASSIGTATKDPMVYDVSGVKIRSSKLAEGFTKEEMMNFLEKTGYVSKRLGANKTSEKFNYNGHEYTREELEKAGIDVDRAINDKQLTKI